MHPHLPTKRHSRSNPMSILRLVQSELSSSGWRRKCVPAPFSLPSPGPPLSASRSWSSPSRGSVLLLLSVEVNCCMAVAWVGGGDFRKKKKEKTWKSFSQLKSSRWKEVKEIPNRFLYLKSNPSAVQEIHVSESFDSSSTTSVCSTDRRRCCGRLVQMDLGRRGGNTNIPVNLVSSRHSTDQLSQPRSVSCCSALTTLRSMRRPRPEHPSLLDFGSAHVFLHLRLARSRAARQPLFV